MYLFRFKFKPLLVLFLLAYLFVLTMGAMTMVMDESGDTSSCPFMGEAVICQMGVFEHITIFQSVFRSVPQESSLILLLSGVLLAVLSLIKKPGLIAQDKFRQFPRTNQSVIATFNKFLLALADGIIQPKLYA